MQSDNVEAMHTFVLVLNTCVLRRWNEALFHKKVSKEEGNMQDTHSYLPNGRGTGSWQRDKRDRINESINEIGTAS